MGERTTFSIGTGRAEGLLSEPSPGGVGIDPFCDVPDSATSAEK